MQYPYNFIIVPLIFQFMKKSYVIPEVEIVETIVEAGFQTSAFDGEWVPITWSAREE